MIESVQAVGYGEAAKSALRAALVAAKAEDPLAAVTVIVPSNFAGLSLRRMLAGAEDDAGRVGIANVDFVTPYRLAELLGRAELAQQTKLPLTTPVLTAAIRVALARRVGFFTRVAGHHATEAALVTCYSELSRARPDTLARLEVQGSVRAQAAVELFARVREGLTAYADEDELARAALGALLGDRAEVAALGTAILYLPEPRPPALTDLLAKLIERVPTRAVVGLTGVPEADSEVRRLCTRLGVELGGSIPDPPTGTEIITVSDPDEEVRAVVRRVLAAAESGVRLDRIAVLYPAPDPYARALHEQLDAAGVPYNGPGVGRLDATVAGRALLRLLALADSDAGRADVMALLAAAPVRDAMGSLVPAARWDLVSRRAGVVGGAADWERKLTNHAAAQRARAEQMEADGANEGSISGARGEADQADELRAFVAELVGALTPPEPGTSWSERVQWARGLVQSVLGNEASWTRWPELELEAARRVDAALTRLAALDTVEPGPTSEVFARAVTVELEASLGRTGRFGEGVVCGPLALGAGLDLDLVFVLGMAEGTCPAPRREDALVSDADRSLAVDGELPLRSERVHEQHRVFLAALASGSTARVLVVPRGDHRTGRSRLPSRWALDTAAALAGVDRVFSSEFGELDAGWLGSVPSYVAGLRDAPIAASIADRDVAALLRHTESGLPLDAHHIASSGALARGIELQRARASNEFTRFDGNLDGQPVPSPALGEVLSATRLQTWAGCPFAYFLGSVLGLGLVEAPEQIVEISALDRGSLVHEVLERFLEPVVAREFVARPQPDEPWSPEEHARLREIAEERFEHYEALGVTGRSLLWQIHRASLVEDLEGFLVEDDAYRQEWLVVPDQVEMAFGFDGLPPVRIQLADGRVVEFRGRADRVDRSLDGSLTVIDYKTGAGAGYGALDQDPVLRGLHLQLPLYAEAARQQLGAEEARAYYWFATQAGGYELHGYELDRSRRDRFVDVLTEIVDGIEDGVFPAEPGPENYWFSSFENCKFCQFDALCPADRDSHAEAVHDAPELVRFRNLADGTDGWEP